MPWVIGNPGDSDKIRLGPTQIRNNWDAIQKADADGAPFLTYYALQIANRTPLGIAADPVTAADTFYLYSRDDAGGGKQELFLRDPITPTPHTIQLTNDGKVGSTSTEFEAESISFDGTTNYDEHSMFRAWCIIDAGASAYVTNHGFVIPPAPAVAITHIAAGQATVSVAGMGVGGADFADANAYSVIATALRDPYPKNAIVGIYNKTATSFSYKVTWGYAASDAGRALETTFILLA